ncbi:AIS_HP2_G0019240.mRNA.1.CDS.1 [Saccharomyces cerevisiae]|nr:AIS_HP2_G0019240.mRNA.1.CDS.1 [Saccharomyces cerevisiae]CAI6516297.1 AIS_HP2_G0019240.mRNA.1.CDS.1 [Saccharomyces cerevisiae]
MSLFIRELGGRRGEDQHIKMIKGVYYNEINTNLEISSSGQCLRFIQETIVPSLTNNGDNTTSIQYHGISKNDNIKQSINKLKKQVCTTDGNSGQQRVLCVFSYGPHIQKMLSILEIFKKDYIKSNKKIYQWNKLTSFDIKREGRNELLEKKLKVPILIAIVSRSEAMNLNLHLFTKQ